MVDLNLAYLLKVAQSPDHHLQREVIHHQEALEGGTHILKEWIQVKRLKFKKKIYFVYIIIRDFVVSL